MKYVLAFDYGASSGRAILGSFDGEKTNIKGESYRFSNRACNSGGGDLYWGYIKTLSRVKTRYTERL